MITHTTADLLLPLTHLSPSATNPRSRMSQAELSALAESIAQHGVMQPLLARPLPGAVDGMPPLEIVAGHRRWRACSLLAQVGRNPHGEGIPVLVHALTDAQVLAMQLVENIQREDLHALDEAEHYRRMRDDAMAPASVDDIAHVGKVSVSRVYARLSLLSLVPAAREAFLDDKLTLKTALQVARLPTALQAEVTQHLSDWGGEPMSPRAAAAFIHERYMLRLAHAPFDPADETLQPEAGACGACPKRTGANPQLFGDISDAETCTDTTCFAAKKAAQHARLVDELQVMGFNVLQGDAARAICTPDGRHLKPGHHLLEDNVPHALGDPALKVADVLTRASAPNGGIQVIDLEANPTVLYAVATTELERALRKIKAHRTQLDKAASRQLEQKAPAAAAAPASEAAAQPNVASPGAAAVGHAETLACATPGQDPDAHEQLVQQLLTFTPPPTSAGKYGHLTADQYAVAKIRQAVGILAGARTAKAMMSGSARGLPEHRMAHMLLILLAWGESYLGDSDACRLCGIELPAVKGSGLRFMSDRMDWLWDLPTADAEALFMTLLASQEHDEKTPLRHFARAVCEGMSIDFGALESEARASVHEQMQLGVLKQEEAAAANKAKPKTKGSGAARAVASCRYRNRRTGETWSGRGLMPKWLKVRLEEGHTLEEFDVTGGGALA